MNNSDKALDRSLVQGIAWLGGMKWATQIASWAVTIFVARLLAPGDYGLFGMAMVYVSLAQLAGEAGVLASVVQTRDLTERFAARLGGFAVMIGVALTAISVGIASLIARFYEEDTVRWLILALSTTFILRGFQLLPRSLLVRELKFRQVAWIDTCEALTVALSTLGYALLGLRAWALVGGVVTGCCASTLLCLTFRRHRIVFPRTIADLEGSARLSMHVMGGQLAWFVYSNADFVVVGRMLGRVALGAYTFGWTIANLAVDRVSNLVIRVAPPIFAAVRNDGVAQRRYLCMLTEGLAFATVPACVGLALVADVLVDTMLGPRWAGAIAPLRLLALYAAFRCIFALVPQVMVFTGHAKRHMQFSMMLACIMPVLFYFGSRWGTAGVATMWLIAYPAFISATYLRYLLRTLELPASRYLRALWPAGSAVAVMTAAVFCLRFGLPAGTRSPVRLALYVSVGALVYITVALTFHGRRLRPLFRLLRSDPKAAATRGSELLTYATADKPDIPRLLLVTYHFPPDPAIGSLRWQKFARHAAARGWGVDVIMRHPDELHSPDQERIADLPPGVRVYGVRTRKSWLNRFENPLARITRHLHVTPPPGSSTARTDIRFPRSVRDLARGYHAVVDHMHGQRWVRDATNAAALIIQRGSHRAVISSGPPHFAHDVARHTARDAELPFAMDMRDPWSMVQRLPESMASPVHLALTSSCEKRNVANAALVVANTARMREQLSAAHPHASSRIIAVPNGYDDDDPLDIRPSATPFTIAYAGTIYLDRDPTTLFQGAAQAISRLGLTPDDFRIEFMGDVEHFNGVSVAQIAADAGVGDFVRLHPARPRAAALDFLASAAVLIQLPQDSDNVIPAKLYEYMRFDAWIVLLTERASASGQLVANTDVDVVPPSDVAGIADVIVKRFEQFSRGLRGQRLTAHERFSRRAMAATFFDALERIAGSAAAEQAPPHFEQSRRRIAQPPDLAAVATSRQG
ncbi:MAG TPA: oligosaccharide flippase family protein [Gemmatimonadaceae bacterium]|jgi:O-antigen/teichoic acid export membrane protein/glycosyltransferase involved in cell wall biosynthesis|nr:oligosaccharide flippase family protein [Gemmatimonadaceae bacterium]